MPYSLEEIGQILALLQEPAATIFAVAAFTGARRGEIRGLMWETTRMEKSRSRDLSGRATLQNQRRARAGVPSR